jgi:ATP-dependent protease ClpP protease subunit
VAKEILLYTSINSWSASDFITALEQCKNDSVCIRVNTPGGSVYDGYGIVAKYNEFSGEKKIKVDGRADSFGAYFLCYTDTENAECLDVSKFTFHRAAMPSWYESDASLFTPEVKAQLTEINNTLRSAIESKCTAQKWKSVTGVALDTMFSLDSRIDVQINAEQAKKLGLVSKINKITPKKLAEIKAYSLDLAAELEPLIEAETINTNTMTIQDVRANTEVYNAIKAEVLASEKIRVNAFAAWEKYDPKAVLAHIVNGDEYNDAVAAKMQVKALSVKGLANMAETNTTTATTTEVVEETDEQKAAAAAQAEMDKINADVLARFK